MFLDIVFGNETSPGGSTPASPLTNSLSPGAISRRKVWKNPLNQQQGRRWMEQAGTPPPSPPHTQTQTPSIVAKHTVNGTREKERKMSPSLLHIFLLEERRTGYLYGNIISWLLPGTTSLQLSAAVETENSLSAKCQRMQMRTQPLNRVSRFVQSCCNLLSVSPTLRLSFLPSLFFFSLFFFLFFLTPSIPFFLFFCSLCFFLPSNHLTMFSNRTPANCVVVRQQRVLKFDTRAEGDADGFECLWYEYIK